MLIFDLIIMLHLYPLNNPKVAILHPSQNNLFDLSTYRQEYY